MPIPLSASGVLAREFFEIRCKILELAASLDRMDRAAGSVANEARYSQLREGIAILLSDAQNRAEQIQLLFSREYDAAWQEHFGMLKR